MAEVRLSLGVSQDLRSSCAHSQVLIDTWCCPSWWFHL